MSRLAISRRTALRGLGLSLTLPWLESTTQANASSPTIPVRMACLFVPNGVHLPDWTPTTTGFGFELPYSLQPLANVRNDLLVLSQLTHDKGRPNGDGPGDHARSASVFLTGAQPRKTDGNAIRAGVSVDQVVAQAIGSQTRFPSLELGCEEGRMAGDCDSGYSCAYSSNISWASESSPVGKELNPHLVFQRLFANGTQSESNGNFLERRALRKSILDYVARDTKQLQKHLSPQDRHKLDEYLHGVRDVERRLEQSTETSLNNIPLGVTSPPPGIPSDYSEHLRLMSDMMVLAFQTDSTRVATFMMANAASNRSYQQLQIPDGHHDLSHHQGNAEKHAKLRRINRFHIEHLAYLLEKLKSIPEGEGTLLDNCMIVYGSGISDGDLHNHDHLPVLLAGRGGGTIDTGRHIRFPEETPMANLLLAMSHRIGAPVDFIGDSTGVLPQLQL
ncbi:MAG: DUF1552 domain-containing protein [Planctomycetota bacterium]|nr:DUF1552 domain-containing protein [Planctomycetota bacterium]